MRLLFQRSLDMVTFEIRNRKAKVEMDSKCRSFYLPLYCKLSPSSRGDGLFPFSRKMTCKLRVLTQSSYSCAIVSGYSYAIVSYSFFPMCNLLKRHVLLPQYLPVFTAIWLQLVDILKGTQL